MRQWTQPWISRQFGTHHCLLDKCAEHREGVHQNSNSAYRTHPARSVIVAPRTRGNISPNSEYRTHSARSVISTPRLCRQILQLGIPRPLGAKRYLSTQNAWKKYPFPFGESHPSGAQRYLITQDVAKHTNSEYRINPARSVILAPRSR